MTQAAIIGRERELEELLGLLQDAAEGRGGVVFLGGVTGSGKSHLLTTLRERTEDVPELERVEVLGALCYETGANNALGPFGEIMRGLTKDDRRRTKARRVLEIVGNVAPPLVELIPFIGKLAATGVKAVSTVGVYALGGSAEAEHQQLAYDIADSLVKVASDETPLLLMVDDAHWIDTASCEVIRRLAPAAASSPILLVVAFDPQLVDDAHPLSRTRSAVLARPSAQTIELGDLGAETVAAVLLERYGSELHPNLARWLADLCEGNGLFLELHLRELERLGAIKSQDGSFALDGDIEGDPGSWHLAGVLAETRVPETLIDLLRPRVADLEGDDRTLLEAASVQGPHFLTTALAHLLQLNEDDMMNRLYEIRERRRIIAFEATEAWWSDRSDLCAFRPEAVRELLYKRYADSPYDRRRRHAAVAEALEWLIEKDERPPRQALLEIAHHYEAARRPVPCARRLLQAAQSSYDEGATHETISLCERAIALLDLVEPGERDLALRARSIVLFIVASEARWRAGGGPAGAPEVLELADEAVAAAADTGDLALQAETRYAQGSALLTFDHLERGIEVLREGLALAREAGDAVAEFSLLLELGHHLDSIDLEAGRDVLRQAEALAASGALDERVHARQLLLARARLEGRIGVAEFDLGNYGEAYRLLPASITALRKGRDLDETAWTLSFLGQLLTALGRFEEAEAGLREGIALFEGEEDVLAVRGYLKTLLGRLYLEWEPPRLADAEPVLAEGRDEVTRSGNRTVQPLSECHYAELLLAKGDADALREADELLAGTMERSDATGWVRSAIAARSLRARVALARERTEDAVRLSAEAVESLAARGGHVPTVRTEEAYFVHARVLEAAGSPEAADWFRRAAEAVCAKAATIDDPAEREQFLTRVRVSREILAAEPQASR
jgi:tetratricopeptide (TPR) repeat protein